MKIITSMLSIISLILLVPAAVFCADVKKMTESQMREASKSMSPQEMKLMENHLKSEIKKAKTSEEKEKLESIFHFFYQGRYDLVMQELKALGDDPQKILKTTGLREKMLSGELERMPWFIREIAALDFLFEKDTKEKLKKWPTAKDKALYIISLVDQLDRNHQKVEDKAILKEAINNVRGKLNELTEYVPAVFKRQITIALAKLDKIPA